MDGTFDDYVLREHPDYTLALGELGAAEGLRLKHFRKALTITFHTLAHNPRTYPAIPSDASVEIRQATTDLYVDDEVVVPPLQIYFVIWEDEKVVDLIDIKKRRGFGFSE